MNNYRLKLLIAAIVSLVLAIVAFVPARATVKAPSFNNIEYQTAPVEQIDQRGRKHKVYDLGGGARQFVFSSSPQFTMNASGDWVDYVFEDYGSYYQVQHPWASVVFYDYYTEVYTENFSDIIIYDDRWVVEYWREQGGGSWANADFYGIARSYEVVSDGIILRRTGSTDIGQRIDEYYFRNGAPTKITITQYSDIDRTIRYKWQPTGIVAASESEIKDTPESDNVVGLKFKNGQGEAVQVMRWYDEIQTANITYTTAIHAQGRKAEVIFSEFLIPGGGYHALDPETFTPDAHVETSSVDGFVDRIPVSETWNTIVNGVGTAFDDDDISLWIYLSADAVNDRWDYLRRSILLFDTATLDGVVTAANLSVKGYNLVHKVDNGNYTPDINVYSSNPASDTELIAADFNTLGTTAFSTPVTYADWAQNTFHVFNLNASGLAAIDIDGVSKFGLRNASYDAANVSPIWVNEQTAYLRAFSADRGGGDEPILSVITIAADPPSVTTGIVTDLNANSASMTGNVSDPGSGNITNRGFEWGTVPGVFTDNVTEAASTTGNYTLEALGLLSDTNYFWRAIALNDITSTYGTGETLTFRTENIFNTIEIIAALNQASIAGPSKPTLVSVGVLTGFSLPIWSDPVNADEQMSYQITMPQIWNATSDFEIHLDVALDTANTDKNFNMQIEWQYYSSGQDILPATFTTDNVQSATGEASQYQSYEVEFEIPYNANVTDPIAPEDGFGFRVRRIAAGSDEISGEIIVSHSGVHFIRGDLDDFLTEIPETGNVTEIDTSGFITEAQMAALATQLTIGVTFLPLILFSVLAFWSRKTQQASRATAVIFTLTAAIAIFTGLAWFDQVGGSTGLAVGLGIIVYGLVCISLAYGNLFRKEKGVD